MFLHKHFYKGNMHVLNLHSKARNAVDFQIVKVSLEGGKCWTWQLRIPSCLIDQPCSGNQTIQIHHPLGCDDTPWKNEKLTFERVMLETPNLVHILCPWNKQFNKINQHHQEKSIKKNGKQIRISVHFAKTNR